MALSEAWRALHRERFSALPLDCGNKADPGVIYSEDLRDWSDKATTPDQARMERYVDRYDLTDKRILHIGIGNSGLAKRFHRRVKEIVGTTIDEPEIRVASGLGVSNYQFVLHNKYSGNHGTIPGKFDFILDNNPSSPCCCIRHLSALIDFYTAKLADDGQIVTDLEGLQWVPDDSNPRWSFDFDDIAAVGAAGGLSAFRANRKVFVLSKGEPRAADPKALWRHRLRYAARLPMRAMRNGPAAIGAIVRRATKLALISTVPWLVPARYKRG